MINHISVYSTLSSQINHIPLYSTLSWSSIPHSGTFDLIMVEYATFRYIRPYHGRPWVIFSNQGPIVYHTPVYSTMIDMFSKGGIIYHAPIYSTITDCSTKVEKYTIFRHIGHWLIFSYQGRIINHIPVYSTLSWSNIPHSGTFSQGRIYRNLVFNWFVLPRWNNIPHSVIFDLIKVEYTAFRYIRPWVILTKVQ